jgi:hypothetical protein
VAIRTVTGRLRNARMRKFAGMTVSARGMSPDTYYARENVRATTARSGCTGSYQQGTVAFGWNKASSLAPVVRPS